MGYDLVVLPEAADVAEAVAQRLAGRLVERRLQAGPTHLVLTGGGLGIASLAHLARNPLVDAIEWDRLHLWWGDERFLPTDHPDRNETQARAALLDARLDLPPANIHPIPPPGGPIVSVADAAAAYAVELARFAADQSPTAVGAGPRLPEFEIVLLGVGPDGHVASLFSGLPHRAIVDRAVTGVNGAPKPPAARVSLTLPALNSAREVWLVIGGAAKHDALARMMAGDSSLPATAASGRERTLWFCDEAAYLGRSDPDAD